MFLSVPTHVMTQEYWILLGLKSLVLDLNCIFIPPLEENHVPKLLKKKIQKERVETAMKNDGQRIAIDFTLSEDMSNKVNTVFLRQFDDFHSPHEHVLSAWMVFTLSAPFIQNSSENFGELAYSIANLYTQNHLKVWILFKFSSDFLSEIRGELKFAFSPR